MFMNDLTDIQRISLIEAAPGKLDLLLDTDTYNEIDDQFAVVYALLARESITVRAICAAPFHNSRSSGPGDGMNKSYEEIQRVLQRLPGSGAVPVARGATQFMSANNKPVESDAVETIVATAMTHGPDNPLYVVSIGAPTNVSSAIVAQPAILGKIVVVWLGGHSRWWPNTNEFNFRQDLAATSVLFDSGVALVQIPCMGVTSHLLVTESEINQFVRDRGAIGEYLAEIFQEYQRGKPKNSSKVIWDIATIGYLRNRNWFAGSYEHSPRINPGMTYSFDPSRHLIRYLYSLDRDAILGDLYQLLV